MTAARIGHDRFPIWWPVVMNDGGGWYYSVRLTNANGVGAALFIDGTEYPVTVDGEYLEVSLDQDQVAAVSDGGVAELFLDLPVRGRMLWLRGTVSKGGQR